MGQATIGPADMVSGAGSWGFNAAAPIDLPDSAESVFPTDVANNPPKLAQASIGQSDVQATPLQMALVAAGVANGGTIMKPHVMTSVRDSQGNEIRKYTPEKWLSPLSPENAATMRQDMLGVVQGGTATGLQIPGFRSGRQDRHGPARHGAAPEPRLDHRLRRPARAAGQRGRRGGRAQPAGGNETGGVVAAPIAKAVMQKVLQVQYGG